MERWGREERNLRIEWRGGGKKKVGREYGEGHVTASAISGVI